MSAPGRHDGTPAATRGGGRDAILRARARELAQTREAEPGDLIALLPFEVGGERYAVEVTAVHQVLDARLVDPLLGAPRGVIGAIMSRSRPVPVFDLRRLLGLEGGALVDLVRVILLDEAGDLYGFAVERVGARVDAPRAELRTAESAPFRWTAPGPTPVLDPARLGADRGEGE